MKRFLGLALLTIMSVFAHADSIELRDGRHLAGRFVGGTEGVIAFSSEGQVGYYSVKDVVVLVFNQEGNNTGNVLEKNSTNPGTIHDSIVPVPMSSKQSKQKAARAVRTN